MKRIAKIKPMARIRIEEDGRVSIRVRYVGMPGMGVSTAYIDPGESYHSRSFRYWKSRAGTTIDLSTCRGSGPGMIGGRKTIRVAWVHSNVCEWGGFRDKAHARSIMREFQNDLADPRISYTRDARRQVLDDIASARKFLKRRAP